MKVIPLRNILVNGVHCAALCEVEVDEATGRALIAQRIAARPLGAGVATAAKARAIETATAAPLVAEVALSAVPKPPRRKAAQ